MLWYKLVISDGEGWKVEETGGSPEHSDPALGSKFWVNRKQHVRWFPDLKALSLTCMHMCTHTEKENN